MQEVDRDDSEESENDISQSQENPSSLSNVNNNNKIQQQKIEGGSDVDEYLEDKGAHLTKELNEQLLKQRESRSVTYLKLFSFTVIASLILISLLEYGQNISTLNTQKNYFHFSILSSNRLSEINTIVSNVRERINLNENIRIPQFSSPGELLPSRSSDEAQLRKDLNQAISTLEELSIKIQSQASLRTNTVVVNFDLKTFDFYELNYAI
jgi:hypothetical protein